MLKLVPSGRGVALALELEFTWRESCSRSDESSARRAETVVESSLLLATTSVSLAALTSIASVCAAYSSLSFLIWASCSAILRSEPLSRASRSCLSLSSASNSLSATVGLACSTCSVLCLPSTSSNLVIQDCSCESSVLSLVWSSLFSTVRRWSVCVNVTTVFSSLYDTSLKCTTERASFLSTLSSFLAWRRRMHDCMSTTRFWSRAYVLRTVLRGRQWDRTLSGTHHPRNRLWSETTAVSMRFCLKLRRMFIPRATAPR